MVSISSRVIFPSDEQAIGLISNWYYQEWKIPVSTTVQNQQALVDGGGQFQAILLKDDVPIATGGVYKHVALLDREPRFRAYKHWLALVYTKPELRGKGYGAEICKFIQGEAKEGGIKELFLFTHTAESLYKRLGWEEIERLSAAGKEIVVMQLNL